MHAHKSSSISLDGVLQTDTFVDPSDTQFIQKELKQHISRSFYRRQNIMKDPVYLAVDAILSNQPRSLEPRIDRAVWR